jgi:hypothetical protein
MPDTGEKENNYEESKGHQGVTAMADTSLGSEKLS